MRNDHVQFVYLTDLDWQVAAGLVQAMNQQNFHPQVLFSAGPAYADQYIAAAGGPSAPTACGSARERRCTSARTQRSSRR